MNSRIKGMIAKQLDDAKVFKIQHLPEKQIINIIEKAVEIAREDEQTKAECKWLTKLANIDIDSRKLSQERKSEEKECENTQKRLFFIKNLQLENTLYKAISQINLLAKLLDGDVEIQSHVISLMLSNIVTQAEENEIWETEHYNDYICNCRTIADLKKGSKEAQEFVDFVYRSRGVI